MTPLELLNRLRKEEESKAELLESGPLMYIKTMCFGCLHTQDECKCEVFQEFARKSSRSTPPCDPAVLADVRAAYIDALKRSFEVVTATAVARVFTEPNHPVKEKI